MTFLRSIGRGNFGAVELALIPRGISNARAQNFFRRVEKNNPTLNPSLVVVKKLKGTYTDVYLCVLNLNL